MVHQIPNTNTVSEYTFISPSAKNNGLTVNQDPRHTPKTSNTRSDHYFQADQLQEQLVTLQEKYAVVHKRNIKLEQENEVLRHCWDKALSDISKLQQEYSLLQHHLNPQELKN